MRIAFFSVSLILCTVFCSPPRTATTNTPSSQAQQCQMAEEMCTDAREFQRQYDSLPADEQKSYAAILTTFTEHCENASKVCGEMKK